MVCLQNLHQKFTSMAYHILYMVYELKTALFGAFFRVSFVPDIWANLENKLWVSQPLRQDLDQTYECIDL